MAVAGDHGAPGGHAAHAVDAAKAMVREMHPYEVEMIVKYFHGMNAEDLDVLGIDPTRLPEREGWTERLRLECSLPFKRRSVLPAVWSLGGAAIGFSTATKIGFAEQAHMQLHIVDPAKRGAGLGTRCVRQSAWLYFELLRVQRVFCEPHALNVAANRALQGAGFKYLGTYWTVPGALNFRHPVTRWIAERGLFGST